MKKPASKKSKPTLRRGAPPAPTTVEFHRISVSVGDVRSPGRAG